MRDIGGKAEGFMKKKTTRKKAHSDEPIGNLKRISDFLPPPNQLLPSEETRKITLVLDDETIESFRNMASENGTKYQRMMREVLKGYAKKYGT